MSCRSIDDLFALKQMTRREIKECVERYFPGERLSSEVVEEIQEFVPMFGKIINKLFVEIISDAENRAKASGRKKILGTDIKLSVRIVVNKHNLEELLE